MSHPLLSLGTLAVAVAAACTLVALGLPDFLRDLKLSSEVKVLMKQMIEQQITQQQQAGATGAVLDMDAKKQMMLKQQMLDQQKQDMLKQQMLQQQQAQ